MTRKDFELIAKALHDDAAHLNPIVDRNYAAMSQHRRGMYDQWHTTVLAVADALATTNPRFDRMRFLEACGIQL